VEVISIPLAFYSLIPKLRPETTLSINTTTTFEASNARRPTVRCNPAFRRDDRYEHK
jgi:hypothetical protein